MTLLAPSGQANVIVSSEPLDARIGATEYAHTQGNLLRQEFPGYREFGFGPFIVFGRYPGFLRHFEWSPPDGVMVTQLQCYYAENGRGYTATATTPSTSYPAYGRELWQILGALVVYA